MWCITTASVVEPLQYSTSFISVKRLGIKRYRRTEVYLEQKWLKNGTILLMSCLLKMHFCLLLSLLPWFWFCILPCHLALFSSVFIVCCFFPFVLPFYLATWFIISLTLTPWWLSLCLFALFFLLSFFFLLRFLHCLMFYSLLWLRVLLFYVSFWFLCSPYPSILTLFDNTLLWVKFFSTYLKTKPISIKSELEAINVLSVVI